MVADVEEWKKVEYMAFHLTDQASTWWRDVASKITERPIDWDVFIDHFLRCFSLLLRRTSSWLASWCRVWGVRSHP